VCNIGVQVLSNVGSASYIHNAAC